MNNDDIDEALGIVRCVRCGQRLEGEVECPFCSNFPDPPKKDSGKWVYLTACFLTSPLSIPFVLATKRLSAVEKVFALSGCFFWLGFSFIWF